MVARFELVVDFGGGHLGVGWILVPVLKLN